VQRGDRADPDEVIATIKSADPAKANQSLPLLKINKKKITTQPRLPFQGYPIETEASDGNQIVKIDYVSTLSRLVFHVYFANETEGRWILISRF
jgi:hypothetical protein